MKAHIITVLAVLINIAVSYLPSTHTVDGTARLHTESKQTISTKEIKLTEVAPLPITAQDYVYAEALKYGWTGGEWESLKTLLTNESGWNTHAVNASSGACGLFQALPCSKLGAPLENVSNQAKWGLAYIHRTYNSPSNALAMWYSRYPHWY